MLRKTIFAAALLLALPVASVSVYGQCHNHGGCGSGIGLLRSGYYSQNCGRQITTQQAAALWADYCHEDCGYHGGGGCGIGCGSGIGCGCFGRKSRGGCRGGFGWNFGPGGCGGVSSGCGAGVSDACGNTGGCGIGKGCFGRRGGKCGLFSGLGKIFRRGHCGGGCGSCYQGCFHQPVMSTVSYAPAPSYGSCGTVSNYGGGGCGSSIGCGSGCKSGGFLRKLVSCFGGRTFGVARGAPKLPCGIGKAFCSRCGKRGGCGCGRSLFGTAIGRVGASGYNGGYFYDSPATTGQFNLYSSGCGTNCCSSGSVLDSSMGAQVGGAFMGAPATGNVGGGMVGFGAVDNTEPASPVNTGEATPGSISPAGVLPGNVVGENN